MGFNEFTLQGGKAMHVDQLWRILLIIGIWPFLFIGCFGDPPPPPQLTLNAPIGINSSASAAMSEGNQRFAEGRWGAAKTLYEQAIQAQPDLAEAHYNLGLVYERLGDRQQARHYYIEAANLAPGHKTIWDSPPLKRHGNVQIKEEVGPPPKLPPLSGIGSGGLGQ